MDQPTLHARITLDSRASEEAVRFTVDREFLVGNLVLPETVPPESLGVIFVHGWSGNRDGPHNLITQIARRCGAAGYPTLRFDLRGRGESDGNGLAVNLQTMAADVVGAVRFLRQRTSARDVVIIGVCSGGNVAIGTLPQLDHVAGLILLSVYPFSDGDRFGRDVNRTWHYAREYARKALRLETWRRLVRGEVRFRQVATVLFGHFAPGRRQAAQQRDHGTEPQPETRVQAAPPREHLSKLRRDLPVLMVYGDADPDTRAARRYYEAHARENRLPVTFVEIPGANHNFSSMPWKDLLTTLMLEFLSGLRPCG